MSKPKPPESFEENPEWTEEEIARARPGAEVLPAEFVAAVRRKPAAERFHDEREVAGEPAARHRSPGALQDRWPGMADADQRRAAQGGGAVTVELTRFDAAEYLDEVEDQTALLVDALATRNPQLIIGTLGIVARARGLQQVARASGLSLQHLERVLSLRGRPTFATIMAVLTALDLSLTVARPEAE